jgi:hypothetical protein
MTSLNIFISLGISIWLAFMMLAIVLPLKPNILKITKKIACQKGSELIIQTAVYSYHRSGQRALEIYTKDKNGIVKSAGLKVIFIFWIMLFAVSLPISIILVTLITNAITKNY